jgi:Domain of unknown function (DUF4189)
MRHRVLVLCGFAVAAMAASFAVSITPSYALMSCHDECAQSEDGSCVQWRQICQTPTPAPVHSYGAIAYGATSHRWGRSFHWPTRSGAESYALKTCASSDCKVVEWFNFECGAVASDRGTGAYGYDSGKTLSLAEAGAERECATRGGKECKVAVSVCSY